jgi:hypothetical protein
MEPRPCKPMYFGEHNGLPDVSSYSYVDASRTKEKARFG